ncbi:Glutathione transferase GST 23 [Vitis vinifera]|uniref:glutathione transferase n=1 Tax=Vitis vinifera TaxID=29760 RepID=A0A438GB81_VITVI|nr:Glutathione transferase GST 23 [Vitis vinifera]
MAEEVKLFRTWSSPFALRIVWALKINGVEYETIFEDLSDKSPSLLQYNPAHKKIPVLVHSGKPIAESYVILEYIDETWKETPLLPEDPYERAMARFWAKFGFDIHFLVCLHQGRKEQEEAMVEAMKNLWLLEEVLRGKKFFGGEKIGFVDLALGWLANLISLLEDVAGLKIVDEDKFPLLSAWMKDFADSPIIKDNWPPRDKMIAKFQALRDAKLAAAASSSK